MHVTSNFWFDLCYHTLSHLPVPAGDASSLFCPDYVQWTQCQCEQLKSKDQNIPRTLVEDAALMSSLYAASPRGWLLHSFPVLWPDAKSFLELMATPFDKIQWPTPEQARFAAALANSLPLELLDLFRTAVWSELKHGYKTIWEKYVRPRTQAYGAFFTQELQKLGHALPELRKISWLLCHPLRVHGRGLTSLSGEPIILTGVADPILRVSTTHPLFQACHEYFVFLAAQRLPKSQPYATCPSHPGFAAFTAVEQEALRLSAELFTATQWQSGYEEWRTSVGAPVGK